MTDARLPYFTIGHSTLSVDQLAARLQAVGVTRLIDVRSFPRSRTNPQFNADTLARDLAERGIAYERLPDLGGRRGRQPGVAPEVNGFWDNASFHHYADWALQPPFAAALATLRRQGQHERCAIMCSEAVWWRCHRRIIADHLLAAGEQVCHLMDGRSEAAHLTPGAQVHGNGTVTYPARAPTADA
ncbi:DUF488 domain-containing protein [Ottowia sp. GY511]|uniref:DUF488 family protein n=1 Tax=Ottowia flava TaxID=2675430 RepID=A0ABW4KZD6_9BURK|nr:DUF488 domain-containing protein [Ottowia sp. GY511]TXK29763.1 DUF488 domain-containing protein [Ottowia sp. GY511]